MSNNNIQNNNVSGNNQRTTKALDEQFVDPSSYEQFLTTCQQGLDKYSNELTNKERDDTTSDKKKQSELTKEIQLEINLINQQINDYLEQPAGTIPSELRASTDKLRDLINQALPNIDIPLEPLKMMQNKIEDVSIKFENNLATPEDVEQVLQESTQLINNTTAQIKLLFEKVNKQTQGITAVSAGVESKEAPSNTSAYSDNINQTNDITQSGKYQALANADDNDEPITIASISYNGNFTVLNNSYSIYILIALLCLEVANTVSDSSALTAQLMSMNQQYSEQLNDDMMAYVSLQDIVPYEYIDGTGNKVQTNDPYIIYSIIAISTPGNSSYDPESDFYDQDLAQKGAGFYQYTNEHCPNLVAYDPSEISDYLSNFDPDNTQKVCEAYNDMAKTMEDLNNNIQYCATHLHMNDPVLEFPETTQEVPNATDNKYTVISLDLDVLNGNQGTITKLQTQSNQLSETLSQEIKAMLDMLTNWLKESSTATEKYGSVTGSMITGQG